MPWAKLIRLKFAFLKMSNTFENIKYFLRFPQKNIQYSGDQMVHKRIFDVSHQKIFNSLMVKGHIKEYLTFPTKKYSIL